MSGEAMTDDEQIAVVEDMLRAWERLDFERAAALFADDAVLHSVMAEPYVGRAQLDERMRSHAVTISHVEFRDRRIGVGAGRVFVQRTDHYTIQGQRIVVPVVGVFTVVDGRIREWLEYFDRQTVLAQKASQA